MKFQQLSSLISPIFAVLIIMGLSFASTIAQSDAGKVPLLETGNARQLNTKPSEQIKIVSYNIRWRSGEELQQIIQWLKNGKAGSPTIIGLQEVDRAKRRSGRVNHAKAIAEALGMYYAWAAPGVAVTDKKDDEEDTGVELLSAYPLTDIARIVLPNPGPGGRQRVAVAATMTIGKISIRVYSVHSETRLTIANKIEQLRAVLDDLDRLPKDTPAIVLGDFNTWELPAIDGIRKLFTDAGFVTPLPDDESTFYRKALMFDVKLKLDWIWLRGLTPSSYGIDRSLTVSDHFPLWTEVKLPQHLAQKPSEVLKE